ncbi:PucR family transcriptional regulator [Fusibacter sp. JL216-2]|uniref:PucR family transcriptional regulator n=1 Tax=Fusibacter sp. JL216-2 TaxID=3071453 RepID=UPI003D331E00
MAIQLKEILKLDILKTFKSATGDVGLDREISKVGILDHELGHVISDNFNPGELVLTNLMYIKDDLSQLEDIVYRLIQAEVGALAIKTLYLKSLPEAVREIAQTNAFPIFFYDEVYYEDVITELAAYMKKTDELHNQLKHVYALKEDKLERDDVRKLAYKINQNFRDYVIVLIMKIYEQDTSRHLSMYLCNQILGKFHKCLMDESHVYIVLSFDEAIRDRSIIGNLLEATGLDKLKTYAGQSCVRFLSDLDKAVQEAHHASQYAVLYDKKDLQTFETIGMYQMLMPLEKNVWVQAYYDKVIDPILAYDEKNGSDLLLTAQIYVENGCDVKKTAQALYQHGNTIRYRLDRIKTLLEGIVEKHLIDQELALVIRLHKVYTQAH